MLHDSRLHHPHRPSRSYSRSSPRSYSSIAIIHDAPHAGWWWWWHSSIGSVHVVLVLVLVLDLVLLVLVLVLMLLMEVLLVGTARREGDGM